MDITEELCKACEDGDNAKVEEILAKWNIDVNSKDQQNFTPLHHAMAYNHPSIVRKLLALSSIRLDVGDSGGWTGLHWACHWNNVECIKLFVTDRRCSHHVLNIKNNGGESALMFAVSWGNLESVKVLAELAGTDFGTKNGSDLALMDLAEKFNHPNIIQFLKTRISKS